MEYFSHTHLIIHQLCESLSYLAGGYVYRKQSTSTLSIKLSSSAQILLLLGLVTGALWGSKLLAMLTYLDALKNQPISVWLEGKTIVGGLLGGLIGIEVSKKLMNITSSTGDRFVYPLLLGMVIGRIGCLQSGIEDYTFGIPTSLPWGMNLGDGISRHPTALYEIIFLMMLSLMLRVVKFKVSGTRFKIFLICYLIFRFFIDFLKPPHGPIIVIKNILPANSYYGLSAIQVACLLGLAYYFYWFLCQTQQRYRSAL